MKNKRGFTLIELLAVIAVIAVLSIIAVPNVVSMYNQIKLKSFVYQARNIYKAVKTQQEKDAIEGEENTRYYYAGENDSENPVKLSGNKEIYYDFETTENKITKVSVSNNEYSINIENAEGISITDISADEVALSSSEEYIAVGSVLAKPKNSNVHETDVPSGYTGIYTIEDLNNMRNSLSGKYILMNDLDFNNDSSYANAENKATYTTGEGWLPVGNSSNNFKGTFNGNNYTISNLFISRPSTDYIGLFGYFYGTLEKLGLKNVNITGKNNTGVIAGFNYYGNITNVYTTGKVVGTDYTGGIVGAENGYSYAKISDSYSTVNVEGQNYVGGLAGHINQGIVKNCFSTGIVSGVSSTGYLIGARHTEWGSISNSYNSSSTSDTNFKSEAFVAAVLKWDVNNIWYVSNSNYPILGGNQSANYTVTTEISTIEDLYMIRSNPSGSYTLMNDLDFNNYSNYKMTYNKQVFSDNEGWLPISSFTGTFNGNNYTIKNLYINNSNLNGVGLFASTSNKIEKLNFENVDITGQDNVGALSGTSSSGPIDKIHVQGKVNGRSRVGLIIGAGSSVAITNSYSSGEVNGTTTVGGFAGSISGYSYGKISNSYSTANVTGTDYVGGLVGYSGDGSIVNCFTTGNVSGVTYAGKLVGSKSSEWGSVSNSYFSSTSTGSSSYGSSTSKENFNKELFIAVMLKWDVKDIWYVSNEDYPVFGGNPDANYVSTLEITKIEDLYMVRTNLSGSYTLMNDLDFNNPDDYRMSYNKAILAEGEGWSPINSFTGTFNGNYHIIKNLYINRPSSTSIGLFGYISSSNFKIEKLGLEDVDITGQDYVGSFVGSHNYGVITNVYSSGEVNGGNYVGGLTGYDYGGTATNTYSSGEVNGSGYVGGLIGYSAYGYINNSFSLANVNASSNGGILLGYINSSSLTNSYRNSNSVIYLASGSASSYGTPITNADFKYEIFAAGALKWDVKNTWYVSNDDYPTLGGNPDANYTNTTEITKIEDLYMARSNPSGSYILMNDLDFNNSSDYRMSYNQDILTSGEGWLPIGNSSTNFTGTFIGNNHVIKNLYINRPTTNYIGLFGYISSSNSKIEKLGLENVNVIGNDNVGGLLGYFYSSATINNSYTTGTVKGNNSVGGLNGSNYLSTTINNSYSTANVEGSTYVGSLFGLQQYGTTTNCFATGNVKAASNAGVLGYGFSSTTTNSYRSNTATVTLSSGSASTNGTSANPTDLQALSLTGLSSWDTSAIWKINSGTYPTFK